MPPRKCGKRYSEDTLQLALKEINQGASLRSVALKYKVPRSTLQNRKSGRTQYQERPGPKTLVLSIEDEKVLLDWVLKTAESGLEMKPSMISKYAKENFNPQGKFSNGWYRGFYRRNPSVQNVIKFAEMQPLHYGMEVKMEEAFIINQYDEDQDEESDEDLYDNLIGETDLIEKKVEILEDLNFEDNISVQDSLCFACAMIIGNSNLNSGIKCSSCLRTYHVTCANKQHFQIELIDRSPLFSCLVCWKRKLESPNLAA